MATHGGAADSYYNEQPPMNPEPKYEQPPPNYGQNYQNPNMGPTPVTAGPDGSKLSFEQTFKLEKPKYNDLWAGILLILTFLGFTAISAISLQGYAAHNSISGTGIYHSSNSFSLNTNTIILFAFVLLTALVLSWAYFLAARAFTKQFIWATGIINILLGIGTAIYYFVRHYYSAAVVFVLFGIFGIICFISWIPRIPFSVVMLQEVMDIATSFGHVFLVSAVGGILSVAFGAWFSVTLVAVYIKYEPSSSSSGPGGENPACSTGSGAGGSCSTAKVIGLIVFITFAGYWITEWLKNTIHSVVSGVYGSWFFCVDDNPSSASSMPRAVTRGALRRSLTYSFGSISFGSLVVALINMLRQALSVAQQQEASQGNMLGSIAFCVLGCLIGLIDWIVQFINRYAFSYIALYGTPYIRAAKSSVTLLKSRGVDILVNDCLISPVLSMGAVTVAYLTAFLSFLYLEFTNPAYNEGGQFTAVVMAFAFLVGLQICQIVMTPLGSGVDAIFVGMSFDGQVLREKHGAFYGRLVSVYPRVQQVVVDA